MLRLLEALLPTLLSAMRGNDLEEQRDTNRSVRGFLGSPKCMAIALGATGFPRFVVIVSTSGRSGAASSTTRKARSTGCWRRATIYPGRGMVRIGWTTRAKVGKRLQLPCAWSSARSEEPDRE